MLSADTLVDTASLANRILQDQPVLVAALDSRATIQLAEANATAEALSRRVQDGLAESVQDLSPATIDDVVTRLGDDPIEFLSALQPSIDSPAELQAALRDTGQIADRFIGLPQTVADRGEGSSVAPDVRSSIQQLLLVSLNPLFDSLRSILSSSSTSIVPIGESTSLGFEPQGDHVIQELRRQTILERLKPTTQDFDATDQVFAKDVLREAQDQRSHRQGSQSQGLDLQQSSSSLQIDASLLSISAAESSKSRDARSIEIINDLNQILARTQQSTTAAADDWERESNWLSAGGLVRVFNELNVSFGNPLGEFANTIGIDEFEFDSLVQTEGSIIDIRARSLGGLTILAAATIVAGHVMRSGRNEKHIAQMVDSQDVDVFDDTVRYDMPNLASLG